MDQQGNVFVTGRSGIINRSSDYATMKYDSSGNQLWTARFGEHGGFNEARALLLSPDGAAYVTGGAIGPNGFSESTTIKYDRDGNRLWVARSSRSGTGCAAGALGIDRLGNLYVTGSDGVTLKYDPDGNMLWEAQYAGSERQDRRPSPTLLR